MFLFVILVARGQAQKEFKVEVEAIGKVRHKNLVGLIGYCAEGPRRYLLITSFVQLCIHNTLVILDDRVSKCPSRMLVYEFVDNGNLEQWLHGDVGPVSPLTWEIRMKIAIGTARG